jgi:hypothetical protein
MLSRNGGDDSLQPAIAAATMPIIDHVNLENMFRVDKGSLGTQTITR